MDVDSERGVDIDGYIVEASIGERKRSCHLNGIPWKASAVVNCVVLEAEDCIFDRFRVFGFGRFVSVGRAGSLIYPSGLFRYDRI